MISEVWFYVCIAFVTPYLWQGAEQIRTHAALEHLNLARTDLLKNAGPWEMNEYEFPRVALVFLVFWGIDSLAVWHRWLEDAYEWLRENGFDDQANRRRLNNHTQSGIPAVAEGASVDEKSQSLFLRGYVHPHWLFKEDFVRQYVPSHLENNILKHRGICRWEDTNNCTYWALKGAHEDFPEANYFVVLSQNTIPLKPFSFMFNEIKRDRRSRIRFKSAAFGPEGEPKVSAWRMQSLEHTLTLLRRSEDWIDVPWLSARHKLEIAASDEFAWMVALQKHYGENLYSQIRASLNEGEEWKPDYGWAFDCWEPQNCPGGILTTTSRPPYILHRPPCNWMRDMAANPIWWWARKVNSQSQVVGCLRPDNLLKMEDFLSINLPLSNTDSVPQPPYPSLAAPDVEHERDPARVKKAFLKAGFAPFMH